MSNEVVLYCRDCSVELFGRMRQIPFSQTCAEACAAEMSSADVVSVMVSKDFISFPFRMSLGGRGFPEI